MNGGWALPAAVVVALLLVTSTGPGTPVLAASGPGPSAPLVPPAAPAPPAPPAPPAAPVAPGTPVRPVTPITPAAPVTPAPAPLVSPAAPVTLATPPFAVTQVWLTTASVGSPCPKTGNLYQCRFTVWVVGQNARIGSVVMGTVTAVGYGVGRSAQQQAPFSVTMAPGTSTGSVSLSMFFGFSPCVTQGGAAPPSRAWPATQQPNAVQSLAVNFGANCP